MVDAERQMPGHVKAAYRDAVENILFLKRQQWLATNYVLLLYVAIFVISAHYFSRTDVARNWLGVITIAPFVGHWWMLHFCRPREPHSARRRGRTGARDRPATAPPRRHTRVPGLSALWRTGSTIDRVMLPPEVPSPRRWS